MKGILLHWTEVLSSHFSLSFFLTNPLWYWNEFLPKYVHCNGLKLRVFYYFTIFWFKSAKIKSFKKIRVLSAVFIKLKYRWLKTCLVDLKKHQTLDILLMTDFYEFIKIHWCIHCHGLKICMCFEYNPQIIFVPFCKLNLTILGHYLSQRGWTGNTLWAQLLQFYTDSFKTSLVFWTWSEDMNVVWI